MEQMALIPRIEEGEIIPQRIGDGYISATALCKSVGKRFSDYNALKSTQDFIAELSQQTGLPNHQLVHIIKGGNAQEQGTWVHPYLAINLGQWLSVKFAVKVSQWVYEWQSGKAKPVMPVHIERYMLNRSKVPHTHFSMLNELVFNLVAPLESAGYTIPANMLPDASEGKMFCNWLRKNRGVEPKHFETYDHEFPDGRVYPAKLYPMEYMEDFKNHFHTVWLPTKAPEYFGQRAPEALKFVEQILLPSPK
ncbi:KilA-N domain-containing protein [Vibrio parahaemolyticus]|uniref:KilA-N domain-containing protein n=1 Tax=Vibrio parahaemolyticus TaxID=670 RepID=UPI00111CB996|nr:KilA-N domain-containing protein [Vibrio parahaemolyticus]HDY8132558.1 KilA-N domain-containing protein [Vibrio vulnificus]TOO21321.1 DNA-binding protein [Vibrio parahaemolyticus]HDY8137093.1 KilA-N domain-containing protein [Vibrio vulnificus]HDY8150604.1 KilA-N domain-containing protein [Vibrio vulnificus]HDY8155129.1 KilA-N domain-containing protein [Vibrio vulnificus]